MVQLHLENFEKDTKTEHLRGALKTCVNKAQAFYSNEIAPQLSNRPATDCGPEAQFWILFSSFILAVIEHVDHRDVDLFCITVDSGDINGILDEFFCLVRAGNVHLQSRGTDAASQASTTKNRIFSTAPAFPMLEISAGDFRSQQLLPSIDLRLDLNQIDKFLLSLDSRRMRAPRLEVHLLQLSLFHEYACWLVHCVEEKRFKSPLFYRVTGRFNGVSGAVRALKTATAKPYRAWFLVFVLAATVAVGFGYAWASAPAVLFALAALFHIQSGAAETQSQTAIRNAYARTLDHFALTKPHLAPLERAMMLKLSGTVFT